MTSLFIIGGIAAILWKLSETKEYYKEVNVQQRRSMDNSMLIDAWKSYGQIIPGSGHPEELFGLKQKGLSLMEVMSQYISANLIGNKSVLENQNYNRDIDRRQHQSGPSEAVTWPTMQMGSAWFEEATRNRNKHLYTGAGEFRT